jgi:hypothetical protein
MKGVVIVASGTPGESAPPPALVAAGKARVTPGSGGAIWVAALVITLAAVAVTFAAGAVVLIGRAGRQAAAGDEPAP